MDKRSLPRAHYNDEVLPGRWVSYKVTEKFKTVKHKNGLGKVSLDPSTAVEFLLVNEPCSVAWVPYTPYRKMPLGAAKGGQKWNDQPLFVAALWTSVESGRKYGFGHYDPEDNLHSMQG